MFFFGIKSKDIRKYIKAARKFTMGILTMVQVSLASLAEVTFFWSSPAPWAARGCFAT